MAAIFAAKGRPRFNPLIVHVTDVAAARALVRWNETAERLAARFWPGALTLVLPRAEGCPLSLLVSAGGDTVGLRAPAHPVAQALLAATVLPVAAPSANPAGQVSPTTADHIEAGLGARIDLIVDGGPCPIGVESTVLDLTCAPPRLAARRGHPRAARGRDRPAGRCRDAFEDDAAALAGPARQPLCACAPAPSRCRRRRRGRGPAGVRAAPARGCRHHPESQDRGDLEQAAANLFAMLRALDRPEHRAIAVMPVPAEGLGEAIRDRLLRAAAPRPAGELIGELPLGMPERMPMIASGPDGPAVAG